MARKRSKPAARQRTQARDRDMPLKLYVNDDEREQIKNNAAAFGMSVSAFLRAVGQGRTPPPVVNLLAIERLAEVSAAQMRLVHLLNGRGSAHLIRQVEDLQTRLSVIASGMGPL
jgi:hypothetical protein